MGNNIGWHIRRCSDGVKTRGGSFGGDIDMETANRLVNVFLDAEVMPSGTVVLKDKKTGETVWLYLSIDARKTEKGKEALKQYNAGRLKKEKEEEERRARVMQALDDLSLDQLEAILSIK